MFENSTLSALDFVVFGISLAISCLYFVNKNKTFKEYTSGGGNQRLWPVAISMAAGYTGTFTMIGNPTELYLHGIGLIIGFTAVLLSWPISAFVFLPVFRNINAISVFKYVELRYSVNLRRLVSIIFILMMTLYSSVQLYVPSLSLYTILGIPKTISIGLIGTISVIYCSLGGLKAVVYTNLYHSLLIIFSLSTILIAGSLSTDKSAILNIITNGDDDNQLSNINNRNDSILISDNSNSFFGFTETFKVAFDGYRLSSNEFFKFDITTRHTIYNMLLGFTIQRCYLHGLSQMQVQSALSLNSLRKGQLSMLLAGIIFLIIQWIGSLIGIVLYKQFKDCDPYSQNEIQRNDELMLHYLTKYLNYIPAIQGLFIAAIFSSTLNSMSSFQNSMSAMVIEDFIRPIFYSDNNNKYIKKDCCANDLKEEEEEASAGLSDEMGAKLSKITSFLFGLLCIMLTILVDKLDGLMQVSMTISSTFGTPIFAVFALGVLTKFINTKGMFCGLVTSLMFGLYIQYQQTYNQPPVKPSLPISTAGCQATTIRGYQSNNLTIIMNSTSALLNNMTPKEEEDFRTSIEGENVIHHVLFGGDGVNNNNINNNNQTSQMKSIFENQESHQSLSIPVNNFESYYMMLERMSYLWMPFFIFVIAIIVSTIVSIFTGGLNQQVDNLYIASFLSSTKQKQSSSDDISEKKIKY